MEWEAFSSSLLSLGYFRYLSEKRKIRIPSMLEKIRRTGSLFSVSVNRDFPANEERLTECGVKDFILEIKPILRANQVVFQPIEEEFSRDIYRIFIDKEVFVLSPPQVLHNPNANLWDVTKKNAFMAINSLLKKSRSEERLFSLYGGNDHWAIFLTLQLYNLMLSSEFIREVKDLVLYENANDRS